MAGEPAPAPELGDPLLLGPLLHPYCKGAASPSSTTSTTSTSTTSSVDAGLVRVLTALAGACVRIARRLRVSSGDARAGAQNAFGDDQLEVDVATDAIVFAALRASGACAVAASEETSEETDMGGEGYSVGFDPLDGSSVIPANFAVGSIFGVWPGAGLVGRTGREQHAACMAVYGSRLTLLLALGSAVTGDAPVALELTLHEGPERQPHAQPSVLDRVHGVSWVVSKRAITIAPHGKVFAPGNLRATGDLPAYGALVQHWLSQRYTLRYTGGMVPDVAHILCKGKGVFTNVASARARAKLRLLYEVAPVGFIVEAAGGSTCTTPAVDGDGDGGGGGGGGDEAPPTSVLDVPVTDLDRRLGCCLGGAGEVALCRRFLFGESDGAA